MKKLESILAEKLLKISAIKLQPDNPFTWSSGWNSPIYTDNRKTLSYPETRSFLKVEMSRLIIENFPDAEVVAGVATGAIALGALVADTLGKPYIYVRSSPKDHGLENLIEGNLKPGQKVVVIEDLVSTGGSSLKAVEAVREGCRHACHLYISIPVGRREFQESRCQTAYSRQLYRDARRSIENQLYQGGRSRDIEIVATGS